MLGATAHKSYGLLFTTYYAGEGIALTVYEYMYCDEQLAWIYYKTWWHKGQTHIVFDCSWSMGFNGSAIDDGVHMTQMNPIHIVM